VVDDFSYCGFHILKPDIILAIYNIDDTFPVVIETEILMEVQKVIKIKMS